MDILLTPASPVFPPLAGELPVSEENCMKEKVTTNRTHSYINLFRSTVECVLLSLSTCGLYDLKSTSLQIPNQWNAAESSDYSTALQLHVSFESCFLY